MGYYKLSICNSKSGHSPAELVDTSRLAAQEDWRQEMRTLKPVGFMAILMNINCLAAQEDLCQEMGTFKSMRAKNTST